MKKETSAEFASGGDPIKAEKIIQEITAKNHIKGGKINTMVYLEYFDSNGKKQGTCILSLLKAVKELRVRRETLKRTYYRATITDDRTLCDIVL